MRPKPTSPTAKIINFNPRTPCGVRLRRNVLGGLHIQFQSTHPLRGATGQRICRAIGAGRISIHAPLAGCDLSAASYLSKFHHFNPRTPCGVRHAYRRCGQGRRHFNPRTPCGVRRAEGQATFYTAAFQSTHPLLGATQAKRQRAGHRPISIHAPLAGCDGTGGKATRAQGDFNPRTPCGVRLSGLEIIQHFQTFQSTHPLRGATTTVIQCRCTQGFQSTHPLRGATRKMRARMRAKNFNPRTPCGVRLLLLSSGCLPSYFNPRTPCGVRHYSIAQSAWQENFNPRTPCGVRLA